MKTGRQRILIVDDEEVVRRFAARVLEEAGYATTTAVDGAEGLRSVREGSSPFVVVLSDIVMPRLNGVELMEALSMSHPRLPVILMTGFAAAQLADRGITAPCGVLNKPFAPEVLVAEVRRCIDRSSPGAPTPSAA